MEGDIILARAAGRVLVAVTTVVLLWVGALHLRPYEYPAGFELMMPEPGCETRCVLGVQARITPVNEAIAILEQHPAVESVSVNEMATRITWRWHDDYSDLYAGRGANVMSVENGRVGSIRMPLDVTLQHLRVMHGTPDQIRYLISGYAEVLVSEVYPGFAVTYNHSCLDDVSLLEHSPITVSGNPLVLPLYNGSKTVFERPGC